LLRAVLVNLKATSRRVLCQKDMYNQHNPGYGDAHCAGGHNQDRKSRISGIFIVLSSESVVRMRPANALAKKRTASC
jgi:hypothetical protein